jgi:hypothetical protein
MAPPELLGVRVAEVVDEHLLGERQRTAQPLTAQGRPCRQPCIDRRLDIYLDIKRS